MPKKDLGKFSVLLSTTEVGLGSMLHAFHVPLAGHFLSLNQGLILTLAAHETEGRKSAAQSASTISTIAALLKVLSPMGKRLTPMLAITVQGLLYSLGVFVFGVNIVGVSIGMMLLSLWGFLQPLILAELIFGNTLWVAIEDMWKRLAVVFSIPVEYGIWILLVGVGVKVLLGVTVGIAGWYFLRWLEENYLSRMQNFTKTLPKPQPRMGSALAGSLKDLLQPWFIGSLTLSVGFLYLNNTMSEFWIVIYFLRTLAIAWLIFWLIRVFPLSWISPALKRFPTLEKTFLQLRGETERVSSRTFKS